VDHDDALSGMLTGVIRDGARSQSSEPSENA